MNTQNSERLYERACKFMPGGVNSPVRACRSVGMSPLFIDHASGSRIYDEDGNEFIDYIWLLGTEYPGTCGPGGNSGGKGGVRPRTYVRCLPQGRDRACGAYPEALPVYGDAAPGEFRN